MNRRGFLKGSLAAAVAPVVAKIPFVNAAPTVAETSLTLNTGAGREVMRVCSSGLMHFGTVEPDTELDGTLIEFRKRDE